MSSPRPFEALIRRSGIFAAGDATARGVHPQELARLVERGVLERVARGRYRRAGAEVTEHHGLALAAAAVPKGVVCLLSALRFHDVTTQNPSEVWIAVARGAATPRVDYPPLRVHRFTGRAFSAGVETHLIEGQSVRVYTLAKTVADLFKFRNRVGVDVAVEALRDSWTSGRIKPADIDPYARICRVWNVMRPYLEALIQ